MRAPGPPPFSVEVAEQAGRFVVRVRGELDLATAPELETVLLPPCRAGRHAVLDMAALDFMDSTGVRVLVTAHRAAQESGGRFALLRPTPASPVGRVLEVSGLDTILELVEEL